MRAPMIVSWMTTNQCNLKCAHCYQDAEEATDKELSDRRGQEDDRRDRPGRFQGDDLLGRRAAHAPRHLRAGGACGRKRPASRVRLERHAHHAQGGGASQGGRGLRHGHLGGQPRCGQARQVPRPAERPRPDHGRHRGVQAGGPAVPAAHHRGGLEPRRGLRHHRLCGGNWRHRALRVLPHPRRPRQVHPGDVASGAGERALAVRHHDEGLPRCPST